MVDTGDLKSPARLGRPGSSPGGGTTFAILHRMWISLLLLCIPSAYAEEIPVSVLTEDISIEQTVMQSISHAHADVSGVGKTLYLRYSTNEPLHLFIVPKGATAFQTLATVLPKGVQKEAQMNLSQSPVWGPGEYTYRLYFFSNADAGAEFHDIEFMDSSVLDTLKAGLLQILHTTPYSPASYHRIVPYQLFGMSLTLLFGIVLLTLVGVMLRQNTKSAVWMIVLLLLLSNIRFSIDALTYSVTHASSWITSETYASAGSIPAIGLELQKQHAKTVQLCNTGTTYAEKLLQYHAYPVRISSDSPEYIIVHKSNDWSFDDNTLRCGTDKWNAEQMHTYPDASILFHVTQ